MIVHFSKRFRSILAKMKPYVHVFIFSYLLLVVTVLITQPTTAYFKDTEKVGGSIQLATSFEEDNAQSTDKGDQNNDDRDESTDALSPDETALTNEGKSQTESNDNDINEDEAKPSEDDSLIDDEQEGNEETESKHETRD